MTDTNAELRNLRFVNLDAVNPTAKEYAVPGDVLSVMIQARSTGLTMSLDEAGTAKLTLTVGIPYTFSVAELASNSLWFHSGSGTIVVEIVEHYRKLL